MLNYFLSIVLYFYISIFKPKLKVDFPCRISPFFAYRIDKNMKNVNLGSAFIGRNVQISNGCCFYDNPILTGNVKIGRYTSINGPSTRICAEINSVIIGSFCSIASNVIIQEYNHRYDNITTYFINSHLIKDKMIQEKSSKGDILIEDDVWIGSNSVILSGVKIGRGCIIGAGSIVTKSIPPYSIVAGNPARIIKQRFDNEKIKMIEESKWWEWDEEEIKLNKAFFFS